MGGVRAPPDNLNQGGHLYYYGKFITYVEWWVEDLDDPGLNRSWEVIKECVLAHAAVDREDGQSVRRARALAWSDFVEALAGGESTFTMFGMAQELTSACADIGRGEELDEIIRNGDLIAGGGRRAWDTVVDEDGNQIPLLQLVWDRDLEDIEQ